MFIIRFFFSFSSIRKFQKIKTSNYISKEIYFENSEINVEKISNGIDNLGYANSLKLKKNYVEELKKLIFDSQNFDLKKISKKKLNLKKMNDESEKDYIQRLESLEISRLTGTINLNDENIDFKSRFDGAICFDVPEHLDPKDSEQFFEKCKSYLTKNGIFICGVPSLESQKYASEVNKKSHINCMEFDDFISLAKKSFETVKPFGMNDEVVHTGYRKMCKYNIVVCSSPK